MSFIAGRLINHYHRAYEGGIMASPTIDFLVLFNSKNKFFDTYLLG